MTPVAAYVMKYPKGLITASNHQQRHFHEFHRLHVAGVWRITRKSDTHPHGRKYTLAFLEKFLAAGIEVIR